MRIAIAFGMASALLAAGCSSAPPDSAGPVYAGYCPAPVPMAPPVAAQSAVPAPAAQPVYRAPTSAPAVAFRTASGSASSDAFLPPPEIRGGRLATAVAVAPAPPPVTAPTIVALPPVISPTAFTPGYATRSFKSAPVPAPMCIGRPAPFVKRATSGPACPT